MTRTTERSSTASTRITVPTRVEETPAMFATLRIRLPILAAASSVLNVPIDFLSL
jgi:hypothetical protein